MFEALRLTRWEWFRLWRRLPFLVLAALSLVIPCLVLLVKVIQEVGWTSAFIGSGFIELAAASASAVSPLLAVVLASFTHASDLQNGSMRTLTSRGAPRACILAAKTLLASALLLSFHVVLLAIAAALSAFLPPQFQAWREGLQAIGVSFLASLLYLSLGIALAHWRQSITFTVGVGLAIVFAESILLPIANTVGAFLEWPVREVTAWTLWGVTQGLQGDSTLLSAAWYIPIVAAYIAALIGLSLQAFRKFDLRAGAE